MLSALLLASLAAAEAPPATAPAAAGQPPAPDLSAPPLPPGPAPLGPSPAAPGPTLGGAPLKAVVTGAAGVLIVDAVCGAWLAASLADSPPMFGGGGGSGDGAGTGLAALCLIAVPPLAAVVGAGAAGVEGSRGAAYWATFGTRLGATALTGWVAAKVAARVSRGEKGLLIPLLFLPSELLLQPWVATRVLVATPRPPARPSPADLARPVVDPAAP